MKIAAITLLAGTASLARATYVLPPLPYAMDALVPYISNETVYYHYMKHTVGYVTNLNAQIPAFPELADMKLFQIIKNTPGDSTTGTKQYIFNQAAQIWNHNFYFKCMAKPSSTGGKGGVVPTSGALYHKLVASFGSVSAFQTAFAAAAAASFGSGWCWLVQNGDALSVVVTHDASDPLAENSGRALLVIDLWEHAYYIDQRNLRNTYIANWWNLVNWDFVESRLQ